MSRQSPTDIVSDFYRAISSADADAIGAIIDDAFAADAAIEWPPSLPHGGRVTGATKLRGLFTAIAQPKAPMAGPANLTLERVFEGDEEVVALISFDWTDPAAGTTEPNSALEKWSFADGVVTEIRAYYWDHTASRQPS